MRQTPVCERSLTRLTRRRPLKFRAFNTLRQLSTELSPPAPLRHVDDSDASPPLELASKHVLNDGSSLNTRSDCANSQASVGLTLPSQHAEPGHRAPNDPGS